MEETRVPGEKHRLTPSHWQLSHMSRPEFEPRQWWKIACSQWRRLRPRGHQSGPKSILAWQPVTWYKLVVFDEYSGFHRNLQLGSHGLVFRIWNFHHFSAIMSKSWLASCNVLRKLEYFVKTIFKGAISMDGYLCSSILIFDKVSNKKNICDDNMMFFLFLV